LTWPASGTTLSPTTAKKPPEHPLTGGVILFARNWKDRAQVSALCQQIKDVRSDLLICVDHEGGRVQRFRTDGFTHLPPMRALGELWMRDALAATNAATACGYVLGAELRACGVDFSFTPVLDLDWGGSGVIGDRAFHRMHVWPHAGQEPDAWPAAGRHGQLRQTLSPAMASSRPTATPTFRWTGAA
jgi:beta-N-acetylhexosaminidase